MTVEIEGYSDVVLVARGGFAVVYQARQDRFNRVVALKVLTVDDLDDRDRARFERECSAMGNLSWHPNVVAVFDSGISADGHPYLTMEYLDAGTLADRITNLGPLPWEQAVATGIEVAGALGAAHAAGTLHRDLKPENLLVGPFGEVKLGDFGIAAIEGSARTTMGQSAYTIAHVPPEVLRGEQPDHRTDVYGLASTIFTLIDGRPPFVDDRDAPVATLITKVLHHDPPGLTGVPDSLDALLRQALAKDRDQRPATVEAFGRALQDIQVEAGLPVTVLRLAPTASTTHGSKAAPRPANTSGRRKLEPRGDANLTVVPSKADRTDRPPVGRTVPEGIAVPPVDLAARQAAPQVHDGPDVPPSTPQRRRGALIAAAVLALLAVAAGAFLVLSGGDDPASTAEAPAPEGSVAVAATVAVGSTPLGIDVTDDGVWVANSGDGTVSRIDPTTDEVVATVPVGLNPVAVAATSEAVWVANGASGTLSRIDPGTNEVIATIEVGDQPFALAATRQAVWVSSDATSSVSRVDPSTNSVVAVIRVEDNPFALAATNQTVWVTSDAGGGVGQSAVGSITAIDVGTNEPGAVFALGQDLGSVAATDADLWVAQTDENLLTRAEPTPPFDADTIEVGRSPSGVALDADRVWVTNNDDGTVSLVDATTNTVVETVAVGGNPVGIAARADTAWVANGADGTVTRIDVSP